MDSLLIGIIVAIGLLTLVVLFVISAEKPEINITQDNVETKITCSDSSTSKKKIPVIILFKDHLTLEEMVAKKTLQTVGRIDYNGQIELIKSYCGDITGTPPLTNVIGANLPEDKLDALRLEPTVSAVGRDHILSGGDSILEKTWVEIDPTLSSLSELDFTYDEAYSTLKNTFQSEGITMSLDLDPEYAERSCNYYTNVEQQKSNGYCLFYRIQDETPRIFAGIFVDGSHAAPHEVIVIQTSNIGMNNLDKIKSVFSIVTRSLVCDCWENIKPGGYDTMGKWIDSLKELSKTGHGLPIKSELALASNHLQIEVSYTHIDDILWKLVITR